MTRNDNKQELWKILIPFLVTAVLGNYVAGVCGATVGIVVVLATAYKLLVIPPESREDGSIDD